jgi:hypothetical protein
VRVTLCRRPAADRGSRAEPAGVPAARVRPLHDDKRRRVAVLAGWMLLGWGLLNLLEGVVNHHLLGIDHVREGANQTAWDVAFLALGAALLVAGWLLTRNQEGAVAPDRVAADGYVREGADAPLSYEGTDGVERRTGAHRRPPAAPSRELHRPSPRAAAGPPAPSVAGPRVRSLRQRPQFAAVGREVA